MGQKLKGLEALLAQAGHSGLQNLLSILDLHEGSRVGALRDLQ
jgi:hypothetical protein